VWQACWMVFAAGLMPWMETKIWLTRTKRPKPSPIWGWILYGIQCVVTALIFAMFVRTFVAEPYRVEGDAVAPELPGGSRCIVWKLARPIVGDIVIYERHGENLDQRQVNDQQVRVMDLERRVQLVSKLAPEYLNNVLPTLGYQDDPNVSRALPALKDTIAMEAWMRSVGVGENHPRVKTLQTQKKAYSTMLADELESYKQMEANQLAFAKDKLKALEARLEGAGKFQTGRVIAVEGSKFIIGRNGIPPFPVSLEEIVGRVFVSTRTQATAAPKPAARVLKAFTSADATISKDVTLDADHAWMVDSAQAQVVRLFEVSNPGVDDCVVIYRAKLKTEGLKGRAYLEMLCGFPQFGEAFSRGLDRTVSGSNDWASYQIPFFLKKGEKPDLIKLNLVVEGAGRVWIKDVELSVAPLGSSPASFVK